MNENEKNILRFFNWLYEKEAPIDTSASIAEATIRCKFLEIFGDFLKSHSTDVKE